MNKKTKIIILVSIVLIIFLCIAVILINDNKDFNEKDITSYIETKVATNIIEMKELDTSKPTIVLFYANFCKSCHEFGPVFEKLQKDFDQKYNFLMLDTEDPKNYSLTIGNVFSLPTLCIFDPEIGNKINIPLNAIRSYNMLKGEFERYLRIRKHIDIQKAKKEHEIFMAEYTKKLKIKK